MWDVEMGGRPLNQAAMEEVLRKHAEAAMHQAVLLTQRTWVGRAERSRRTGHYLRSITYRVTVHGSGGRYMVEGHLGTNVFYARYLEEGTGLYGPEHHWIVPKEGRVLRFPSGGQHNYDPGTGAHQGFENAPGFRLSGQQRQGAAGAGARYVYARRVRGIKPRKFAHDAALVAEPHVLTTFRSAAQQAAHELAAMVR